MILSVRVNNFLVYSNEVELSAKADMHIKKFSDNVYRSKHFNILKSICIYGANNSGKTCLIRAINSIKNVLLGIVAEVPPNIFSNDATCSLGISFVEGERSFSYDFKYDSVIENGYKRGFIYECMKELFVDKYGNYSEKELFIRDVLNNEYRFVENEDLSRILGFVSNDNILIYTVNTSKYPVVEKYKKVLRDFAENIDILNMNNIPIEKTISALKNNEKIKEKTVELIKLADLDIDDYRYVNNDHTNAVSNESDGPRPQEEILKNAISVEDMFKLVSIHKGKAVQSLSFDSTGTKKIVAVASYVVDALFSGKTLIIDELDSSLHFKLTRAIVSLFNNKLNDGAQLIFTAHDVTLLDCKKLFRKDQIWFASKGFNSEYLYSLDDFTAQEDKIRSETDLFEKYNSGVLGAVPEPDLISILLSNSKEEGKNNE